MSVTPDGRHVYVAGRDDDAVSVFDRDHETDRLMLLQELRDGQEGVAGLDGIYQVVISPDENNLYAAGAHENAVTVFARDPNTGLLTFLEVLRDR